MKSVYFIILFTVFESSYTENASFNELFVPAHRQVLDMNLFESVLDPELCERQIRYIQENQTELLLQFLDAGYRTPRGVLTGNIVDLGNYYQCLGINRQIPDSIVEGKYCMIELPLNQSWPTLPTLPIWPREWPELMTAQYGAFNGAGSNYNRIANSSFAALTLRLGVCVPKACTPRTALNSFFNSAEISRIEFTEAYCRLPNDKQWVAGDYIAIIIFSLFGLLVMLSTAYDLHYNVFLQKDPRRPVQVKKLFLAFSAYTNTRRLVTYNPVPGTLECLDGIRSLAMIWVIMGHTYVAQGSSQIMANPADALEWMTTLRSVLITSSPITVDTFFLLSGLLLVYTSVGKLTSMILLKSLHRFYLNRFLRMFPVLAVTILLQVSVLSRVADGPYWNVEIEQTHNCRMNWWHTLLYVQNFVDPMHMCLSHSWYLAIDMQLHILSPIVLVWVLTGRRRIAWSALAGAMITIMIASITYIFVKQFPSGNAIPPRPYNSVTYQFSYYINTLARAPSFFVGLIFGYILHISRGKRVVLPFFITNILWLCTTTIAFLVIYSMYPIMQLDWDNQVADSMINAFMRPAWAMFIGWLIFACEHGYGGPVNWVLCLRAWKVLSRLSYAMYLVHFPLMFVVFAMPVMPIYFSERFLIFHFLADLSLAVIVSFLVTIFIDAPCSEIIKHFMGPGPKKPPPKIELQEMREDRENL